MSTLLMRRYVDQVVAIDERVRWSIREISDVRVIYNPGQDYRDPAVMPNPRPAVPVRVTFLAGLADFKGVFDLIEAARLLRHRTDIVFRLYGENRWSPDYYRSFPGRIGVGLGVTRDIEHEIREIVAREKLSGTVELMGYVHTSAAVFHETDILAFPSHLNAEPSPHKTPNNSRVSA